MVVALEQQAGSKEWQNEKSREVRLGVVMYGGISLAIYINGVAQELFRAVHGRGIYRLIKALTDSDVVVDVISGTSAGGINGIYLSYALCNGKDFSQFADLWRDHGDINKLLRAPDGEMPEASSFLDSEGYYQPQLEAAFRSMGAYEVEASEEDFSAFRELDLFVTGTDVDGNVYTQFDDAGHPVDIKDHRAVFLLKHRGDRKQQFSPGPHPEVTHRALAKLSRLTSCFPVAFSPVHVDLVEEGNDSVDAKLQLWGKLGKEACFLDGGLLDNKPFTYTLKAIFSRTADQEVDRKLLYVEPDPEVMQQAERASNPNFLQATLAALIGIPGYESIAEDLKLLSERNSKLTQYNRLVRQFKPPQGEIPAETRRLYDRSRLIALTDRVVDGLFRKDGRNQQIPLKYQKHATELVQMFDRLTAIPDSILEDFDASFRLRRLYRLVYQIYGILYGTGEGERQVLPEAKRLGYRGLWQALNRHIKLYEIVLAAMESLVDDAPIPWENLPPEQEHQIWPLVEAGYYRLLDANGPVAKHIKIDDLREFLDKNRDEWLLSDELEKVRKDFVEVSKDIIELVLKGKLGLKDPNARTFLGAVDECEGLLLDHFVPEADDPVRQAYDTFDKLDAHLFPLELVGNLHEKDIIETIRISPKDARRGFSALDLSAKVAGDSVYHFGGFFKRSWRSNDILWGRLDGLCQLVETLLGCKRVEALVSAQGSREMIRSRFFNEQGDFRTALDPASLFPRSGKPTHDKCRRWLTNLLDEDDDARTKALDQKKFDEMVTLLVEAAQLEVLGEDLPKVMVDAIQEQIEWNRFQMVDDNGDSVPGEPSGTLPPFLFQSGRGYLDPLVASSEVQIRVKKAMKILGKGDGSPSRPIETGLGSFFRDSYKVGSEKLLRDIPTLILLETVSKALLVARTCILGLFGSEASRLRRSLLYRLCIDWPLRAFHALVGLARRSPGWGLGVLLGLGVLSLLALAVGVVWWPDLVHPAGASPVPGAHWSRTGLITFILVPLAILLLLGIFLLWGSKWLFQVKAWRRLRRQRTEARKQQKKEKEKPASNLQTLRQITTQTLEDRFGRLSSRTRKKLKAIDSVEKLGSLISGDRSALVELGLDEPPPPSRSDSGSTA
ncbi:MAG TPA: patatin-like protein [Thermoanaerobaculia bacterium]|jgi:patatin-related protein|nr:patatin-like protein [Thermoanaerobaculia bacterium]